jgi:hypothetical protein
MPSSNANQGELKQKDVVIGGGGDQGTKGNKAYDVGGAPTVKTRDENQGGGTDPTTKDPRTYPVEGK